MAADEPGHGDERRVASVGYHAFGLSQLPLIIGIALLFFNGRSIAGWLLSIAGAVIIFVGILANLEIYFRPTSLFNTVMMLVLLAGGIGLVARAVRPRPRGRRIGLDSRCRSAASHEVPMTGKPRVGKYSWRALLLSNTKSVDQATSRCDSARATFSCVLFCRSPS